MYRNASYQKTCRCSKFLSSFNKIQAQTPIDEAAKIRQNKRTAKVCSEFCTVKGKL